MGLLFTLRDWGYLRQNGQLGMCICGFHSTNTAETWSVFSIMLLEWILFSWFFSYFSSQSECPYSFSILAFFVWFSRSSFWKPSNITYLLELPLKLSQCPTFPTMYNIPVVAHTRVVRDCRFLTVSWLITIALSDENMVQLPLPLTEWPPPETLKS